LPQRAKAQHQSGSGLLRRRRDVTRIDVKPAAGAIASARGLAARAAPQSFERKGAMAEEIQIAGAGTSAKVRNPVVVAILSVVTIGIYVVFWWYFINRELADLGRAKGTSELGDDPTKSTLALFPGGLVIVPAVWTTVTTFQRVQAAQRLTQQSPINGWLGLVLYVVISPAFFGYMQSGLNGVWRSQAAAGTSAPEA
jgi:Domain of unknown function (DUF4234)